MRGMLLFIWFLSRSIIQNDEIMSFENSDKQTWRSSSEIIPSFSFLTKTDVNSAIVMLAIVKMPSGSLNISSTFSEPVSTWYLLTRALVSKKYRGITCFFLLLFLLQQRFLW